MHYHPKTIHTQNICKYTAGMCELVLWRVLCPLCRLGGFPVWPCCFLHHRADDCCGWRLQRGRVLGLADLKPCTDYACMYACSWHAASACNQAAFLQHLLI